MIADYLAIFDQKLGKKPQDMYYGNFLKSVRHSQDGGYIFVQGCVSAEMIKRCTYKVDVKLDCHGVAEESQCECAVGMGPDAHCKHVMLVLVALTRARDGIKTAETCTQQLQTFHQAKKYSGSPVKMRYLKLRRDGSLSHILNVDPRPVEYRNRPEYPDHFRSVWLNSRTKDIPIRHMFKAANVRGVHHDHDYLSETPEDQFLHELNVTRITEDQRDQVERKTRGQSMNKAWRHERTKRVHSSNVGRVCNATDRTDLTKLARSYTRPKIFHSAPTDHGKKYEGKALDGYSESLKSGIQVSLTTPYLRCSPDGLVGKDGVVEVKCPYTARDMMVTPVTVPYLSMTDGNFELKKNHPYYFQVQGNLLCTGRELCDFVVWTKVDSQCIHITRDEAFIANMTQKLGEFFNLHLREEILKKFLYRI